MDNQNNNCHSELVSESKNKKCIMGKSCLYCGTNYCNFVDEVKQLKKQNEELKAENERLKATVLQKCPNCNEEYLSPIGASLYEENERLKEEIKPFQDDYFKGLDNEVIAGLAKKSIRITAENRKLESALREINNGYKRKVRKDEYFKQDEI